MKAIIREKINLLKDFCIISRKHDENEERIRDMLKMCTTERDIERTLHDLLTGEETLEHLLARKGV